MYIKRLNTDLEEDALLTMIDRVDTIKKNNEINKALIEMKEKYSLRNAAYMVKSENCCKFASARLMTA